MMNKMQVAENFAQPAPKKHQEFPSPRVARAAPGGTTGTDRLLRLTTPYMRGHDVEVVQEQLNDAGAGPIGVDGIYGPATASAVRRFQQANGLTVDGIVGPQTRAALSRVAVHA